MNKSDLIKHLLKRNKIYEKSDIEDSINLLLNFISNTLYENNRVEIRVFGSFSLRKRNKRIGRNPKTGKSILVEEKYHPYFRASKDLKEVLKN